MLRNSRKRPRVIRPPVSAFLPLLTCIPLPLCPSDFDFESSLSLFSSGFGRRPTHITTGIFLKTRISLKKINDFFPHSSKKRLVSCFKTYKNVSKPIPRCLVATGQTPPPLVGQCQTGGGGKKKEASCQAQFYKNFLPFPSKK